MVHGVDPLERADPCGRKYEQTDQHIPNKKYAQAGFVNPIEKLYPIHSITVNIDLFNKSKKYIVRRKLIIKMLILFIC